MPRILHVALLLGCLIGVPGDGKNLGGARAWAAPLVSASAGPENRSRESVQPGIISHETTVTIRQPERVTPVTAPSRPVQNSVGRDVRVWTIPRESFSEKSARQASAPRNTFLDTAPGASTDGVVGAADSDGVRERTVNAAENALPVSSAQTGKAQNTVANDVDVYAMSPYARFLALPHMVAPAYSRRLREGVPPPAWNAIIGEAAELFGLDKALIASVIRVESNFQAAAESPKGAQGAMQIMPETQVDLGLIDPFDPRANVYAGAQYLRAQIDRFGRVDLALAAYNAGPGSVQKYGGVPPFDETQDFVQRVMAHCGGACQ